MNDHNFYINVYKVMLKFITHLLCCIANIKNNIFQKLKPILFNYDNFKMIKKHCIIHGFDSKKCKVEEFHSLIKNCSKEFDDFKKFRLKMEKIIDNYTTYLTTNEIGKIKLKVYLDKAKKCKII